MRLVVCLVAFGCSQGFVSELRGGEDERDGGTNDISPSDDASSTAPSADMLAAASPADLAFPGPAIACPQGNLSYAPYSFPIGVTNPLNGTRYDHCNFDMTRKKTWIVGETYAYCFDFSACEAETKKKISYLGARLMVNANNPSLAADLRVQLLSPNGRVFRNKDGNLNSWDDNLGSTFLLQNIPHTSGKWVLQFKVADADPGYGWYFGNTLLSVGGL